MIRAAGVGRRFASTGTPIAVDAILLAAAIQGNVMATVTEIRERIVCNGWVNVLMIVKFDDVNLSSDLSPSLGTARIEPL